MRGDAYTRRRGLGGAHAPHNAVKVVAAGRAGADEGVGERSRRHKHEAAGAIGLVGPLRHRRPAGRCGNGAAIRRKEDADIKGMFRRWRGLKRSFAENENNCQILKTNNSYCCSYRPPNISSGLNTAKSVLIAPFCTKYRHIGDACEGSRVRADGALTQKATTDIRGGTTTWRSQIAKCLPLTKRSQQELEGWGIGGGRRTAHM